MAYWQLFYHCVWATRERAPWISAQIEPVVHATLRQKAVGLGATVYAVNGMEDHVHLVVAIPPKIAVARFIGQVKAVTSVKLNRSGLLDHPFSWQATYGVFSFDRKRLPPIVDYVDRQKQHHATDTTVAALERSHPS